MKHSSHLHPAPTTLPPNFFHNHPPPTPRQPTLRHHLHQALRPAQTHKWLADWLFSDVTPFHRNIPLPPETFSTSLAIRISHTFLDITVCPLSNNLHTSDAELLLLPVASLDNLTVGYVFSAALTLPGTLSAPTAGRFVFDAPNAHLLLMLASPPKSVLPLENASIIMSVQKTPTNSRAHTFFAVPKLNYSYECLPNHVFSMCCAEASDNVTPLQDALDSIFAQEDPAFHLVDSLINTEALPPPSPSLAKSLLQAWTHTPQTAATPAEGTVASPWDDDGHLADGVRPARVCGEAATSSGMFEYAILKEALKAMAVTMRGAFYASRHRQEPEVLFRNVVARLEVAGGDRMTVLQSMARELYYGVVNSVGKDVVEREEMKRRRNRISAAKSNLKRKILWDEKKERLRELKDRVEGLERRREDLKRQNEELKDRLKKQA